MLERDVDDCMETGGRATHGAVAENSYLSGDAVDDGPMSQLRGHSITYRIAVGPQQGRKVFTLQTLPAGDPEDQFGDTVGKVAGFSLPQGTPLAPSRVSPCARKCGGPGP